MSHVFISYSTHDTTYARRLADALIERGFDVWIDNKRLRGGDDWWKSIVRALRGCSAFIVLLSPRSDGSKWVQREITLADNWDKPMFPILLEGDLDTDNFLLFVRTQYEDARNDNLPASAFFERLAQAVPRSRVGANVTTRAMAVATETPEIIAEYSAPPPLEEHTFGPNTFDIEAAIDAFQAAEANGEWQEAMDWLIQIRDSGMAPPYFLLDEHIEDTQAQIERLQAVQRQQQAQAERERQQQAWLAEAARGYDLIWQRVERDDAPDRIWKMLDAFWADYPNYDPDDLALKLPKVRTILPGPFAWCYVPAGPVTISYGEWKNRFRYRIDRNETYQLPAFYMSKYAITNAQFAVFEQAADGYQHDAWWAFSEAAQNWWETYRQRPKKTGFQGDDLPRTNITWYEAQAFCRWLSARPGNETTILLPTEQQWQRAAQGDDGRDYPWGNDFEKRCCNVKGSGVRRVNPVDDYADFASPFGLIGMSGNVWEWTASAWDSGGPIEANDLGVVRGGAFNAMPGFARCAYRHAGDLDDPMTSRGFRVMALQLGQQTVG